MISTPFKYGAWPPVGTVFVGGTANQPASGHRDEVAALIPRTLAPRSLIRAVSALCQVLLVLPIERLREAVNSQPRCNIQTHTEEAGRAVHVCGHIYRVLQSVIATFADI